MKKLIPLFFLFAYSVSGFSQAGSLDVTFDSDGIAIWDSTSEWANSVIVQPDGKTLAGGTVNDTLALWDILILRFLEDGSPDPSFGVNGAVITDLGNDIDEIRSLSLQADGKIVALGHSKDAASANVMPMLLRFHPDGSPDSTFNGNGRLLLSNGVMHEYRSALVQDDGMILAIGKTDSVNFSVNVIMRRFHPDGSPDSSFGIAGTVVTDFPVWNEYVACAAILPDYKIVVSGTTFDPINGVGDFFVVRYLASGAPDTAFSSDGRATIDLTDYDNGTGLALQADGKIVVAGYTGLSPSWSLKLARLNTDGSPDASFDFDGIASPGITIAFNQVHLALQPDGKILAATSADDAGSRNVLVARFNADGSFDTSFDGDGITETDYGAEETVTCIALQPDGKIVVAGKVFVAGFLDVIVLRYLSGLPIGIEDPTSLHSALLVFPNPMHGTATMEYSLLESGPVNISVYDQQGKFMMLLSENEYRAAGLNREPIRTSENLPTGIYYLVITSGSETKSAKILVE